MQSQFGLPEEELKEAKEQLTAVEAEKECLLDELREMKKVAKEAKLRLSEALLAQTGPQQCSEIEKSLDDELEWSSIEVAKKRDQAWHLDLEAVKKQKAMDVDAFSSALQELDQVHQELTVALDAVKMAEDMRNVADTNARRVQELSAEVESVKESLANSREQLEIKHTEVEALRIELEKAKYLAVVLEEKEASLKKLKHDLNYTKESKSQAMDDLSEAKRKLHMIEYEMEKAKESESKMLSLLTLQTKQLEQTKILLEECRFELTCLNEKVEYLERSDEQNSTENATSHSCYSHSMEETVAALKSELQFVKKCLNHSQEGEALAQSKAKALAHELNLLRTELKLATDAEEKNRKAMDDLALVLREVSMEANEAKGKLISSQSERENAMREVECLKQVMKSTEEMYVELLSKARNEIKQIKDEAERLRIEAEESNLVWNRKEVGFINCIKGTEEEFHDIKQENSKLLESMREAEHITKVSKEETNKLRDILKQALNEANVAKEAAEIARNENYKLKDSLAEKDITLQDLTRENERLRINEATALENIKNMRRLLSTATTRRTATQQPEEAFKGQIPTCKESDEDGKTLAEVVSVDTKDLRVSNGYKEADKEPKKDKTLKTSSVFTDDAVTLNSEDFDHLDGNQVNNMDDDRNKNKKKNALLRRFGHLLKNNLP
ncbi:putative WEB family protein At1g65010, chloroplastic [Telopea speciosissima]|uniref:putative WEB family protein At1g65010, chloroplastic n=1 Tax=Telopea speciosissima TaxID=54955 RepID=UPI001CC37E6C|nr:putative WEB family protein At1g65010, chloroplastic [Telopea speciosissima]